MYIKLGGLWSSTADPSVPRRSKLIREKINMKSIIVVLAAMAIVVRAQIPSLGFCPEYLPMLDFDMERFTGIWYEAERYFQLTEVASRCVMSNYTKGSTGKFHVINEVTSRFTGIKRVLEGEIRRSTVKGEAGKLHVKYTSVPLIPLETQYNVLETDYDSYAVLWSCSGVGPVHTQNAWIMTRERLAPGEVLQKAYGVLDKYRISRVFFVKTNQEDCAFLDSLEQAPKPTEPPKKATTAAPIPVAAPTENETAEQPQPIAGKSAVEVRPHIIPDAPDAIIKTRNAEIDAKEKASVKQPEIELVSPVISEPVEAVVETVKSVPEVIMKIADQVKELAKEPVVESVKEPNEPLKEEPIAAPVVAAAEEPKESAPVILEEEKKDEIEKKTEIVEEKIETVKA